MSNLQDALAYQAPTARRNTSSEELLKPSPDAGAGARDELGVEVGVLLALHERDRVSRPAARLHEGEPSV